MKPGKYIALTRSVPIEIRLEALSPDSYIHQVHHTHNSKEVLQYIRYINGDINIDRTMHRYVFRACYLKNDFIINRAKLKEEYLAADSVFIELCSRKKYMKNNYFIHHLAADQGDAHPNNLIENANAKYGLTIQNKAEIESDILAIIKLLCGKKIVFIMHVDCGIETRKIFNDELSEIFNKHNLCYVDPSCKFDVLEKEMETANHYTPLGAQIVTDYILEKIETERTF